MTDLAFEMTPAMEAMVGDMDPKWLMYANFLIDPTDHRPMVEKYQAVYPDAKDYAGACVSATRLSRKQIVVDYVKEARAHLARSQLMGLDEIKLEIQKQAFADITQFIDWQVVYRVESEDGLINVTDTNDEGDPIDDEGEVIHKDRIIKTSFQPIIKRSARDIPPHLRRMIKSIQLTKTGPKFELIDQSKAMDMLVKMIGGYAAEKHEHFGPGGSPLGLQKMEIEFVDGDTKEPPAPEETKSDG